LRTGLLDAFRHLLPNDNFHSQTPVKMPHLTYFAVKNASWQLWLRIEIG